MRRRPPLAPRFPDVPGSRPFSVITVDGLVIRGHRLGRGRTAVVFCHGFTGSRKKPRLVRFQQRLAARFRVYAFDFRGHGDSGGLCGFGSNEHLDVDAVVRVALEDGVEGLVTVGGSMGGIAVIRHAALLGGMDAVAAISAPARWDGHASKAVRRMRWMATSPIGRRLLASAGVRVADGWERTEDPVDLIGRIAPTPVLVVHGRDDHYFDAEQAMLLFRRAAEPKRLLMASRFGHAEDGYSPGFADRLGTELERLLRDAKVS